MNEVKELVAQMGTHLTDEEASNLFRVMDADGSGSVDFKEFATGILLVYLLYWYKVPVLVQSY